MEREISQGKNIVRAAAKQLDTLDRLVFSTLSDPGNWSNGETMDLYHFNSTATSTQCLKDEFPELTKRTSYLQLCNFLSNWKILKPVMFKKQNDGSMLIQYHIAKNAVAHPFTNAPHDTGHFARALILSEKAPAGTTMAGYRGEPIQIEEYATLWGKVNNMAVSCRPFSHQESLDGGFPEWLVLELLKNGIYQSKQRCDGGDPEVKSAQECGVDMNNLPSIEHWMRSKDWGSVL